MNKLKSIEVRWHDQTVGKLALTDQSLCAFEYSNAFLREGVSISPFELPLRPGVFIANPLPFNGGFGVFDDSLPDGWGQLILDRYLQTKGINVKELSILDRLSLVGCNGRGALEFIPDKSVRSNDDFADFERLATEAEDILCTEEHTGEGVEEFQKRGGSPGGARPKIFVKNEEKEWLVKFRAKEDPGNIGKIEFHYSKLAKACGVEMPETRLFEEKFFGVERFDRNKGQKYHVVSMAGLLSADYRIPSIDYLHIFKVSNSLSHDREDLWKIYRLMAFNFLIGNKDDHAKNFAFIYKDDRWKFSPAFDILPGGGINGYRTTSINDSIDPDVNHLIDLAAKVNLDKKKAEAIIYDMKDKIVSTPKP